MPHPLPQRPTDARPGSEMKIRVLTARAERGELLFHPQDASCLAHGPSPQQGGGPQGRRRYRGVSRCRHRWRARIWDPVLKRKISLGFFGTQHEALSAVQAARSALLARA
jgi:hypothetical protein